MREREGMPWRQAVEEALAVLGGRWVVAVLAALAQGELHTNELIAEINAIDDEYGRHGNRRPLTHRVLKDTVTRMQRDGLLTEYRAPTPHPSVQYKLTRRGQALLVALRPLAAWAQANGAAPTDPTATM